MTAGNFVAWHCQPTIPVFRAGIYGLAVQLDGLLKVVLLEEHIPFQLDLKRGLKGRVCHPQFRKRKEVSSAIKIKLGVLPWSGRCAADPQAHSLLTADLTWVSANSAAAQLMLLLYTIYSNDLGNWQT